MAGRKFKPMKKLLIFSLICLVFTACQKVEQAKLLTGRALGTTYQVKYFASQDLKVKEDLDSIFEVINTSMSTYQTDSDISKINRGDSTVQVDEHFQQVFKISKQIYEESDGYFDPTVGNLVNAYGFGPEVAPVKLKDEVLDSLTMLVGFDKLRLDNKNRVIKDKPKIYIDFNAIAKGYTIDVIADYLDKSSVENYLIELGGELVAKGKNIEKNSDWIVAIDDPGQEQGERTLQTILVLKDKAMATSGNYRKFRVDSTGKRFVHTINPKSGKAETSSLLSTSVLAKNCTLADGYATAFMALGYEKSRKMLEQLDGVEVYFIYSSGDKEVKVFASEGFKEALRDQ